MRLMDHLQCDLQKYKSVEKAGTSLMNFYMYLIPTKYNSTCVFVSLFVFFPPASVIDVFEL